MMKRLPFLVSCLVLGVGGVVVATSFSTSAIVNGKTYADSVITQGGKTYVSVDALKQGGAQVSSSPTGLAVNFVPLGGRNQVDAVEAGLMEWMQNDLWRIRVESIGEAPNPYGRGPGLVAKIEFRNLSSRPISPFQSGMDKLQIIDKSQQSLPFQQQSFKSFFNNVPPGGAITETILFGDPQNKIQSIAELEKLMIFFRLSGGKKAKDFRVFLKKES